MRRHETPVPAQALAWPPGTDSDEVSAGVLVTWAAPQGYAEVGGVVVPVRLVGVPEAACGQVVEVTLLRKRRWRLRQRR